MTELRVKFSESSASLQLLDEKGRCLPVLGLIDEFHGPLEACLLAALLHFNVAQEPTKQGRGAEAVGIESGRKQGSD